jgi:hypothetical protein
VGKGKGTKPKKATTKQATGIAALSNTRGGVVRRERGNKETTD